MLCGYPPFTGKDEDEILQNVRRGVFRFAGPGWANISQTVKDLIQKMLVIDTDLRISAKSVLAHPWFKEMSMTSDPAVLHPDGIRNLQTFVVSFKQHGTKLQLATLAYITNRFTTQQETRRLRELFTSVDTNHDGFITLEELQYGYAQLEIEPPYNLPQVLRSVDMDKDGRLSLNEFITAAIDWNKSLSEQRLRAAFKEYDTDGNNKITVDEIKQFIKNNESIGDHLWSAIMKEVDSNNDGVVNYNQIDFEEFVGAISRGLDYYN